MTKFISIVKKDLLLLLRDWPGLAILFIMPAVLLVIITFIQENSNPVKNSGTGIIIVDADSSKLGTSIINDLKNSGYFKFNMLTDTLEAKNELLKGKSQVAVIIPDSSTENLLKFLDHDPGSGLVNDSLNHETDEKILFMFSPTLQTTFRNAITTPLRLVIQLSAVRVMMEAFKDTVNQRFEQLTDKLSEKILTDDFADKIPDFPYKEEFISNLRNEISGITKIEKAKRILPASQFPGNELDIEEKTLSENKISGLKSGALQNNIPAFTLFAMFFIVIPLAGSIINEKNQGIYSRLKIFPVSYIDILLAKVSVFLMVCILQFIMLLMIGVYIMPLLGEISKLNLNVSYLSLIVTIVACSLAAIGFGVLVGTFASNHGQAATFGSVMVVILAMLGGIFVPSFMLPEFLKKISMISPLRWGTDALLGIFAGKPGFSENWIQLCLLSVFFIISVFISAKTFRRS